MNWMNKLERKFGKYAISNISLVLIICYAVGYIISYINKDFLYDYLTLDPYRLLHGQVWRLVTWIIVPPSDFSVWTLLMLYFYYSIGTVLEKTWGTFRYNLYLFSGMIFTLIGSLLIYLLAQLGVLGTAEIAILGTESFYMVVGSMFSTYYVNMSIFLAYAATYPNMQVYLMFVIPLKVKVLGIIYALLLVYEFFTGHMITKFVIGASLLNFVVFFLSTRNAMQYSPKQIKRRQTYKREVKRATGVTKHKCAICGRTEEQNPEVEFRFCSKCEGNYEYCQDHLFTHEHVRRH